MHNKEKKVTQESVETIINQDTGEIVETKSRKQYKVAREPDYIKMYIDDLSLLNGISNNAILYHVVTRMNYELEVFLTGRVVKLICEKCNVQKRHFYRCLKQYVEKGILSKIDQTEYTVNPYLFARGKWEDIEKIRLTVEYSANGRELTTEMIEKQDVLASAQPHN